RHRRAEPLDELLVVATIRDPEGLGAALVGLRRAAAVMREHRESLEDVRAHRILRLREFERLAEDAVGLIEPTCLEERLAELASQDEARAPGHLRLRVAAELLLAGDGERVVEELDDGLVVAATRAHARRLLDDHERLERRLGAERVVRAELHGERL